MERKLPIAAVTPVARLRLLKVNPVWVITIELGRAKVGIPEIRLEVIVALVTVAIVAAPGVNMTLLMCSVNASPTDIFTSPTAMLKFPAPIENVLLGAGLLSNTSKAPLTLLKLRFRPVTFGNNWTLGAKNEICALDAVGLFKSRLNC